MCSPTAALSGVSAIGGMMGQQQQANAQYAANKAQRQYQINQQRSKLTLDTAKYNRKKADRQAADIEVGRAGNEAYLGNQRKYNEKINAFMVNKQNRLIKSMELAGTMGARGQSGGSITAMLNANDAATGRDTATALAGLRSAATSLATDNRGIQNKMAGDYRENFSQIGDLPTQGFTPPEVAKPAGLNPLSIAASLGSVVVDGMSAASAANTLPNGQTQSMLGGGNSFTDYTGPSLTDNTFSNYNSGISW